VSKNRLAILLGVFVLLSYVLGFFVTTERRSKNVSAMNVRYFKWGKGHALIFLPILPLEYMVHRPVLWLWLDSRGAPSHFAMGGGSALH
jgi:hypothetical protein